MKRKILIVLLVLAAAVVLIQGTGTEKRSNTTLKIGGETIKVEVANTSSERKQGLMYRRNLAEDRGMIFIYPEEGNRSFWMKNTHVPLDIIFVDADGSVINVEQADPQPRTSDENLERYRSKRAAKYVIEVNQGFSRENNIKRGSEVSFGEELANCCIK